MSNWECRRGEIPAHPDELAKLHKQTATFLEKQFEGIPYFDETAPIYDTEYGSLPVLDRTPVRMVDLRGAAIVAITPMAAETLNIGPDSVLRTLHGGAYLMRSPDSQPIYQPSHCWYAIDQDRMLSIYHNLSAVCGADIDAEENWQTEWLNHQYLDAESELTSRRNFITSYECAALSEVMTHADTIIRYPFPYFAP